MSRTQEKGSNLIFNPKFESDTIQDDQAVMNVSKTPTAYLEPPDHIVHAIRKSSVRTYIMKMENPTILNLITSSPPPPHQRNLITPIKIKTFNTILGTREKGQSRYGPIPTFTPTTKQ
jgi:hypothetical protein